MVSALCGVTEPTIYSIALTNIKLFAAGMIGGGIVGKELMLVFMDLLFVQL